MLYRQKIDTLIRIFTGSNGTIGYIINTHGNDDRVFDSSGAVFLGVLSREPQSLNELLEKIILSFAGVSKDDIKDDVVAFFDTLEQDGFIVSGTSKAECDTKDNYLSYTDTRSTAIIKNVPQMHRATKTSQQFLEDFFKVNPQLTQFQIELSSRCNERCIHCYIPHESKNTDIAPELFYDVLEQCREMGVIEVKISGGEPMMHKNFVGFLRKIKDFDLTVTVLSNLTLLNDEIIIAMKECRLSGVQVSLYSMKPETHDSITQQPGSFEKTKNAILRLLENDVPVQISCPIMKKNKNDYVDVLKWANENKVHVGTDYIMMARSDKTTDNLDNRLSLDETEVLLKDIMNNDLEYQKNLLISDIVESDRRDTGNDLLCSVCIMSLCMTANGNIYPCAGWSDYICGNLREKKLREIWDNSPKVQYLRGLRKKDFPKCLSCADKSFCAMCMVRNANENPEGDPLKINEHFCKVAALNRKIVMDWKGRLQA